jgi:hypothetical protein
VPIVTMQSFFPVHIGVPGRPAEFFRWDGDDGGYSDPDFQRVMLYTNEATTAKWFEVDRSGPGVVLRWTDNSDNEYELEPGSPGTYWHPAVKDAGVTGPGPGRFDVSGYWRCNGQGRPYDLNDLLAVRGPSRITGLYGKLDGRVLHLEWTPNPDYVAYEVHEFLKVPGSTLKATVTEPSRTSGALAPDQTLEYAVRGVSDGGSIGPFSGTVVVTLGADSGTVVPGAPGKTIPSEEAP